jgi:sulfur-oxidizing protein SoxY
MSRTISRLACAAAVGFALCGWVAASAAQEGSAAQRDPWPELAEQIFKGRVLADGAGVLAIEMPGRAESAGIVPVTVRATLPPGDLRRVKAFTIVIDENPRRWQRSSVSDRTRSFRRSRPACASIPTPTCMVAELSDGNLSSSRLCEGLRRLFCARPKNAEQADLGQRGFGNSPNRPRPAASEAQIMIGTRTIPGCNGPDLAALHSGLFRRGREYLAGRQLVLAMEGASQCRRIPISASPMRQRRSRSVSRSPTQSLVFKGDWPFQASRCDALLQASKQRTSASACARRDHWSRFRLLGRAEHGAELTGQLGRLKRFLRNIAARKAEPMRWCRWSRNTAQGAASPLVFMQGGRNRPALRSGIVELGRAADVLSRLRPRAASQAVCVP